MISLAVAGAILGVVGLLGYVWKHRTGTIARGIGAAGAKYNELYGQGAPPQLPPPAVHSLAKRNDGNKANETTAGHRDVAPGS